METQNPITLNAVASPSANLTATQLSVGQLPSLTQLPHIRDPEWLKLEVCREHQRGACKRSAEECRYAHPSKHIQVSADGKVIACYDAIKGKCTRDSCKYLHPTPQLKLQIEVNGKQTLMQNRAMLQQMLPLHPTAIPQGLVGYEQMTAAAGSAQPLAGGLQAGQFYSPAIAAPAPAAYSVIPSSDLAALTQPILPYYQLTAAPTQVAAMLPAPAGSSRADKLEVCRDFLRGNCTRGENECRYGHPADRSMIDTTDNTVTVCMDCIKGRCTRDKCKYFHPPPHLQAKIRAAQNPNAAYITSLSPAAMTSPQPTVMTAPKRVLTIEDPMTNGAALGQPPLKRHALDSSIITSGGNTIGNSSGLTTSTNTAHQALTALYGYTGSTLPGLATINHQNLATPTYYHQAIPMLHLQYGANASALTAAAAAQAAPLAPFNMPTTSSSSVTPSPASYALLNGQNQLAGDVSSKSIVHHVTNMPYTSGTLTVCRDFQSGKCTRPTCRFVHVNEDYVEVKDDKVTICRNALQGKCSRPHCKFYHLPLNPVITGPGANMVEIAYGESSPISATVTSPGVWA